MYIEPLRAGAYTRVPYPLSALFDEEDAYYIMGIPSDGSCMLHAILSALSAEYCVAYSEEAKQQHVRRLRHTLSALLRSGRLMPADRALDKHYRTVVQRELDNAHGFLGQEIALVLGEYYNVNIFMLQLNSNGKLALLPGFTKIHANQPSMILLCRNQHYESIVCMQTRRTTRLTGTFHWHDPIVHKLRVLYVLLTRYNKAMRSRHVDFGELCTWTLAELVGLHTHLTTTTTTTTTTR